MFIFNLYIFPFSFFFFADDIKEIFIILLKLKIGKTGNDAEKNTLH